MCEVSRTCSVTHHSVRRRSIILWRSRVSRAVLLLVPSKASEKEQQFVAQLCALERRTAPGGRDSIDHAQSAHDDLRSSSGAPRKAMQTGSHPDAASCPHTAFARAACGGGAAVSHAPPSRPCAARL